MAQKSPIDSGAVSAQASAQLQQALELFEEGVNLKRRSLRRQFPSAEPVEIETRLLQWLAYED